MARKKEYETSKDLLRIIKQLGTGVKDELDALGEGPLRDEIVQADAAMREIAAEMRGDAKLSGAKEIVQELAAAYRDAKKAQAAKVKYALYRLDEMGKL